MRVAQNGKQLLIALQLWRDDVNAKGGLLGRPVELVYYDDQSNPSNVPGIYNKLINVDKVDLLLGPYATNMVAAAMPVIVENNKLTISMMAVGINRHFNYPKYFSMLSLGPDGVRAFSKGFFDLAAAAEAEAADGRDAIGRCRICSRPLRTARARTPPPTVSRSSTTRAIRRQRRILRRPCAPSRPCNPDVVFVAAYPPDTVGIVRAAHEIGLKPKMFGGTMIGLLITPIKAQLGPILDGLVIMESFVPAPTFDFPGLPMCSSVIALWRRARKSIRWVTALCRSAMPPDRCWRRRSKEPRASIPTSSRDYIHSHKFETVVGEIAIRHGRGMDAGADRVHPIPECGAKQFRAVRRWQG